MILTIFGYELEITLNKIENLSIEEIRNGIQRQLREDYQGKLEIETIIPKSYIQPLKDSFQLEYEFCTDTKETQKWFQFEVKSHSFWKVKFITKHGGYDNIVN